MEAFLKRGKEEIRTPKDLQSRNSDTGSAKKENIGLVLRQARRALVARRLLGILFFLIIAAVVLGFIFTGFFDQLIHDLIEAIR